MMPVNMRLIWDLGFGISDFGLWIADCGLTLSLVGGLVSFFDGEGGVVSLADFIASIG
jgi:hypothetical protein